MKRLRSLSRLAAVASSVLLVAGCISYRAGGFDWLKDRPPAPSESQANGEQNPPATMSGTKVGIFLSGAGPGGQLQPTTEAEKPPEAPPTVMPGTKSSFFSTFPVYGKTPPREALYRWLKPEKEKGSFENHPPADQPPGDRAPPAKDK